MAVNETRPETNLEYRVLSSIAAHYDEWTDLVDNHDALQLVKRKEGGQAGQAHQIRLSVDRITITNI